MNNQTWKNFERSVARYFGTERMPLSGMSNFLEKQDTLSDNFFIECKLRTKLPIWDFWAKNGDFRLKNDWLVIHSKSFKKWIKPEKNTNKFKAVLSLYDKTEKLAEGSGKIPIIAIKKFKMRGFLLIIKEKDMDKIKQIIEPEVEFNLKPQHKAAKINTNYLSISDILPLVREAKNFINFLVGKPVVDFLAEVKIDDVSFYQISKEMAKSIFKKVPIYEIFVEQGNERLIRKLEEAENYNVEPENITLNTSVFTWIKAHPQQLIDELENLVYQGAFPKRDYLVLAKEIAKRISIKTTIN